MRRALLIGLAGAAVVAGCGGGDDSTAEPSPAVREAEELQREEQAPKRGEGSERVDEIVREHREKEKREAQVTAGAKQSEGAETAGDKRSNSPPVAATKPKSSEAATCGTWPGPEASSCELSYAECQLEARSVVKSYYEETGADLNEYAERHANQSYGSSGASEEAAYEGCLAALFDEYDALYG